MQAKVNQRVWQAAKKAGSMRVIGGTLQFLEGSLGGARPVPNVATTIGLSAVGIALKCIVEAMPRCSTTAPPPSEPSAIALAPLRAGLAPRACPFARCLPCDGIRV
ncbi:hypothetical protein [Caballeronia sp. GAWG1-1]|uniref:hypothetical protein n=1 Tax=Caballeronia sp. GAWG1-1 TaxID=2921742 RepID=UPI0020285C11|nr:hypothetical protein [Caballeronia sp. GAWG1-1]